MVLVLRQKLGISVFIKAAPAAKTVVMATALRVSFCFFFDAHLLSQVSRTLLQYIHRYHFFSILPHFSCKPYDVITDLICIIEKRHYL